METFAYLIEPFQFAF